jgi:hypothetical protein
MILDALVWITFKAAGIVLLMGVFAWGWRNFVK